MKPNRRILVLGAYGFIGSEIYRHLKLSGHDVTAFGRNSTSALKAFPQANWRFGDVAKFTKDTDWSDALQDMDIVINATGALQDSPENNLDDLQHHAVRALAQACKQNAIQLIQISAVDAAPDANTEFLASKGRGDQAIMHEMSNYIIFRPGLVLGAHAYGGTAFMRMVASTPLVLPIAFANTTIQTIAMCDITKAVNLAIEGRYPAGFVADLVERKTHSLKELFLELRAWMGVPKPKFILKLPIGFAHLGAKMGDLAIYLGWRVAMRSTVFTILQKDMVGTYNAHLHFTPLSLQDTLLHYSAPLDVKQNARIMGLLPLIIIGLSLFWILSGAIGLVQLQSAAGHLPNWPAGLAFFSVVFWSIIDILLGAAIIFRKWAQKAAMGMTLVSLIYLLLATIFTPELWSDPLGPLLKIIPAFLLSLLASVILEKR